MNDRVLRALILVVSWGIIYCRFIETPLPVNTTLGATANFHCSAARTPFWFINGRAASPNTDNEINISEPQRMGDSIHSTLTVLASHGKNNSLIQCGVLIIHEHRGLVSSPVELKVQGLLAAPGNIGIILNTMKVTITWSPPFTLNITGARGIHGYIVYITDLNFRNISCESVNNVQYTFIIEENQCHEYSFQVSAVNAVGEGNRSSAALLPQPKQNLKCSGTSSSDTQVVILPSLKITTRISIQPSSVSLTQGSLPARTSTVLSSSPLCPESNTVGLAAWIGSGIVIGCTLLFLLFGLSCFLILKKSRKNILASEIEMEENEAYQKPTLQQGQNSYNMIKNSAYGFTSKHGHLKII